MIAAVYARKSTDQAGVAEDQKSVARQVEHARAYAARKGWTVPAEFIFVDDGISGAEFLARPGFVQLMNALKPRAPFQVLVMSEESRLGRESIEVSYALKQLVKAGVRVFFYLEDRERTLDSPTDKIMLSLATFADELEREKARQRTYDAMQRKARAGHVTGGRCFGYDNFEISGPGGERDHVELRINEAEAAVIRRIFELAALGEGLRAIAKRLNADAAPAPRSQRNRPRGWAPSSVREVLYRETYRGRRIWNKTRKRNKWGEAKVKDRPANEWLTVEREALRIVPEPLWQAAHARRAARSEARTVGGAAIRTDGRGVRTKYFLTGFGRCARCGGSMQALSRDSGGRRVFRYCCATYWNRGRAVCDNGRSVFMDAADRAVRDLLAQEVLRPDIVEAAVTKAVTLLTTRRPDRARRTAVLRRLAALEVELANLSDTAARGGAVPAVLAALEAREAERGRLSAELAAIDAQGQPGRVATPARLEDELRAHLEDWHGLLTAHVAEARPLLGLVLGGDRIAFRPADDGRYELTVPVAFDRVVVAAVPGLAGLQDRVASPPGIEPGSRP